MAGHRWRSRYDRGRGDLLELFEHRGIQIELQGADRLLAACARNDSNAVRDIAKREPLVVKEILADGGRLLAEFAGVGNSQESGTFST